MNQTTAEGAALQPRQHSLACQEGQRPASGPANARETTMDRAKGSLAKSCIALAAGIAFILLSGCTSQIGTKVEKAMAQAKADSLEGWKTVMLDGKPLLDALSEHTAMLLRNAVSVSLEGNGRKYEINATFGPGGGFAAAVPIAEDGYFLTAGHVVNDASSLVLIRYFEPENAEAKLQKLSIRIVWQPPPSLPLRSSTGMEMDDPLLGSDIAIVHAKGDSLAPFTMISQPPQIDEPIVIAGWPIGHPGVARMAAGRVLSVIERDPVGDAPAYAIIGHDAPTVRGDSGGPVLDRQGKLIGVNSAGGWSTSLWRGITTVLGRTPRPDQVEIKNWAIMPDRAWLRQTIENDRLRKTGE